MLLAALLLDTTTTTNQPCQRARGQPAANSRGHVHLAGPRVVLSSRQCHAEVLPNVCWSLVHLLLVATGRVLHRSALRRNHLPPFLAPARPAAAATAAAPAAQTVITLLLPLT